MNSLPRLEIRVLVGNLEVALQWPGLEAWTELVSRGGGTVIYGRFDAIINRQGIRMGTSELYRAVEAVDEELDSLMIDLEYLERPSYMPSFIVLKEGMVLSDGLRQCSNPEIRQALTARQMSSKIVKVEQMLRTLTGKKLEAPVRSLMLGHELSKVLNLVSVANLQTLDWYVAAS